MTKANAALIADHLQELSTIGADPAGGFSRLVYTKPEREAHAAFRRWLGEYGLKTSTDAVGNSFGRLAGSEEGLPALMSGSHLDTVYQGGNFDGTVGVVAAAEFITKVERRALRHATTVATVGTVRVSPGSLTTVPGRVVLGLDVRDIDNTEVRRQQIERLERVNANRDDNAVRAASYAGPVVRAATST